MKEYIGIDIHRKFIWVCMIDEEDHKLLNCRVEMEEGAIRKLFSQVEAGAEAAVEATMSWMWLCDLLGSMGVEMHLVHPAGVKLIAKSRLKTDQVDAFTLARLLRSRFLPEAYLAPPEVRDQRMLVRHRQSLVKMQTMTKNRVHAVLTRYNLHLPQTDIFGAEGMKDLHALELPSPSDEVLADDLALVEEFKDYLRKIERDILKKAPHDPRVPIVMTAPGFGKVLSHAALAQIGETSRFLSDDAFCSYCGIVPPTHQSAGKVRHGSIRGGGTPVLRWILVEAANTAIRCDSTCATLYHKHLNSKGRQRAVVIVAHWLARVLYRMLKENRPYQAKRTSPVGPSRPLAATAK